MSEAAIRLGIFLGLLTSFLVWEQLAPRRPWTLPRWRRWPGHLGLQLVATLLLRLLFPMAAVGLALFYQQHQIGLLHLLALPGWLAVLLSLLVLDLAIYLQHRLSHHWPWLWRLHRLHHTDTVLDVTTALRFHPLEILLSMAWKAAVLAALGAPVIAVLLFEILLNGTALFNHANIRIAARWDRYLRWFVVTPDMHRVHHSTLPSETNSNYGFCLPWWDYCLRTYQAQPQAGHEKMRLGLTYFRAAKENRLRQLLTQPFRDADSA